MQTYEQQTLRFGGDAAFYNVRFSLRISDISTSSRGDSPASRSRLPANEEARKTTATSGRRCSEQYGRFVPNGSWARMFTDSLIGRTDWFSTRCALTWKMQATRSGRLYFRLLLSALPTAGTGCGLLPTVQTQGLKRCENGRTVFFPVTMLPTPTAIDAGSGRMNRSPSPNASERPTLAMAAKIGLLPTPTVNDATNASLPASLSTRKSGIAKVAMQSGEYRAGAGFRLNPRYVAEMMGFPPNWTESPFRHGSGNLSKHSEMP